MQKGEKNNNWRGGRSADNSIAHRTFSPWRSCANGTRVVASESMWREPLKWDKAAAKAGERHRVFCASLADVFEDWQGPMVDSKGNVLGIQVEGPEEDWSDAQMMLPGGGWVKGAVKTARRIINRQAVMQDFRVHLFSLIDATPHLDWLLLTKRPENIAKMMPTQEEPAGPFRHNLWLGVSVENQEAANRLHHLAEVPAAVKFVSAEPLIGPLVLQGECDGKVYNWLDPKHPRAVHWVICCGPGARPCRVEWIRSIVGQCKAAGVACFVKQLGSNPMHEGNYPPNVVKRLLELRLRDRKGGDMEEWPADLRVREFPEVAHV